MRCKISLFQIENYKSINKVNIKPDKELNVFIGRNGSGKTVFMSAIKILRTLLHNYHRFYDNDDNLKIPESVSSVKAVFEVEGVEFEYFVKFDLDAETDKYSRHKYPTFNEHWTIKDGRKTKKKIKLPLNIINELIYTIKGSNKRRMAYSGHFRLNNKTSNNFKLINTYSDYFLEIIHYIENLKYYSATQFVSPSNSPTSFEVDDKDDLKEYYGGRESHRKFLYDLYRLSRKDKELYEIFIQTVCDPRLELIKKIQFHETKLPSYDVTVRSGGKVVRKKSSKTIILPFFYKDSYKLLANQLSEGTFKTLALLFYIMSDKGSALIIEEPEVCVHHGLLDNVIDVIKTYSSDKQIFLTTHSENVLDSIDPKHLFVVKWSGETEIQTLEKFLGKKQLTNLKKYLTESGNLGEFIKCGDFLNV